MHACNIIDMLAYFMFPAFIIPFWAARFFARGNTESAKTGLVVNLLISLIVFPIYLVLIPIINAYALHVSETQLLLYTVASLQIFESYALIVLESLLLVKRPQMIGYGSVILEVTKVTVGIALIPRFKLLGAISVMLIASLIQLVFYLKFIIGELKAKIKWNYVKEWLKGSFFNVISAIGQRVASLNLIMLFIFGGGLARGFYGAAQTIAAAVGYSAALGFALYPKLLSEKRKEDALTSLKLILMFAIPMAVGVMTLPNFYLTILKPEFAGASLILIVLALWFLIGSISSFLETVVYGTERLDEKDRIPIRVLLKSRIFLLAILPYVSSAVTLPTLFYILVSAPRQAFEAALYLTLIDLVAGVALLIIRYRLAMKCLPFVFPKKTVAKYCLAAAAMIPVLFMIPQLANLSGTSDVPLLEAGAYFATTTLIGAAVYFAVLCLIDKETREIIGFIVKKVQGSF